MCGVFGIVGEYSPSKARAALATLGHRGRDHCGIVEKEGVFLAHQRLSITDIHERSHQPMRHKTVLLSFNGEIYNHRELREELDGFAWQTHSDAEVILAAYKRWGIGCVQRFEGMFAFALIDGQKLYLVRDRFGKKPMFYYHDSQRFVFASEIKAIKPFLKSVVMNEEAMRSYLSFLAPAPPHTFYEGIQKLESGEWLCFENHRIHKESYYDLMNTPSSAITSYDEALSMIEENLHRAIAMRLDSHQSSAALLSGGIDSALICAIAASQGKKLPTYTLGYDEYSGYDERSNAKESAKELGLEHTEV
ncbi:MAG TPA: asparagine synthetase B, partial [Sulfuricurvum sp.]|nr:asparagine synthetase B [Sulfuricurvum sp.]